MARFEPHELNHALRNHWIKPDLPRKDVPELHRRVRKALGIRTRRPACRRKPEPVTDEKMAPETITTTLAKRRLTKLSMLAHEARYTALVGPMSVALAKLEPDLREIRDALPATRRATTAEAIAPDDFTTRR